MICLICRQAEVVDGFISVKLEREEINLMVNNVPAGVCPSCGEAYLEEDIASQVLSMAKERSEAGELDAHYEYKST